MKILNNQNKKKTLCKKVLGEREQDRKHKEWQSEVKLGRKGNHDHLQVPMESTKMPLPLC